MILSSSTQKPDFLSKKQFPHSNDELTETHNVHDWEDFPISLDVSLWEWHKDQEEMPQISAKNQSEYDTGKNV